MSKAWLGTVILFTGGLLRLSGQIPYPPQFQGERVDFDTALTRSLKTSSLVEEGKPFHAILAIGSPDSPFSGRVEVWWAAADKYKSVISSPAFSQTRIVNGSQVMESDSGDYFPRWLETFKDAILDPIPMIGNFRGRSGTVMLGSQINRSCAGRDDRADGRTDWITWGSICFSGSQPHLLSVQTTNFNLEFGDWKSFGKKQIAHTYKTDVLDHKEIEARLTKIEELHDVSSEFFAITIPTPSGQQIKSEFVSTQKEEGLLENAPVIDWPTVHEGKTDGYMIVYARTDRTGRVRETAKHNSDNPGLESFGMEQALRYKFKPLLVNGVAEQMEMPLVLHFSTKIADPLPFLTGEALLKQIRGCDARLVSSVPPYVRATATSISVNEQGELTGEGYGPTVNPGSPAVLVAVKIGLTFDCHFAPFLKNGVPWYYHGALLVAH
ncbi:MAG: hypothetical protein P4K83_08295 [Terracidiphilus sp.]|nr:hypothetical protein [Terracidiphilus sp.]